VSLYLDSSALVKLIQAEPESGALRQYLRRHSRDPRVTSTLARVEVVRAVAPGGPHAVAQARRQLARLHHVPMDRRLLDQASALAPGTLLRSLDAIHLASALFLGSDLAGVVTYDGRMADDARSLNLAVESPA
jgi:predicted nucleic acid-binding protein